MSACIAAAGSVIELPVVCEEVGIISIEIRQADKQRSVESSCRLGRQLLASHASDAADWTFADDGNIDAGGSADHLTLIDRVTAATSV